MIAHPHLAHLHPALMPPVPALTPPSTALSPPSYILSPPDHESIVHACPHPQTLSCTRGPRRSCAIPSFMRRPRRSRAVLLVCAVFLIRSVSLIRAIPVIHAPSPSFTHGPRHACAVPVMHARSPSCTRGPVVHAWSRCSHVVPLFTRGHIVHAWSPSFTRSPRRARTVPIVHAWSPSFMCGWAVPSFMMRRPPGMNASPDSFVGHRKGKGVKPNNSVQAHQDRELKWISTMTSSDAAQAQKSKKIRKLLVEGVPSSMRYLVWAHISNSSSKKMPNVYAQLCKQRPAFAHDIERDVELYVYH